MRLLTHAAILSVVLLIAVASPPASPAASSQKPSRPAARSFSYARYAALLQRAVNPAGHVAYATLKSDPALAAVLAEFAAASPESAPQLFPGRADKLAYWINAYNLFVLAGVTRKWPARSVRDDGTDTFFTDMRFVAGGKRYTLNHIEGEIIRKRFREPRIHFTINCGAKSCPVLRPVPFTGSDLERRLDEGARLFLNDPRNVRVDTAAGVLWVPAIFEWYAADFLAAPPAVRAGVAPSIQAYIRHYLDEPARTLLDGAPLTLRYLDYDWSLNADSLPVR